MFEFSDRFADVDSDGFVKNWKDFGPNFVQLLNTQYQSSAFYSGWDIDLESIFIPLKLLPGGRVGRNGLANNETFVNATGKLMIFRKVFRTK